MPCASPLEPGREWVFAGKEKEVRWRLGEPKTVAAGERIPLTLDGDPARTLWLSLHREGIRIDAVEGEPPEVELGWLLKFPLARGASWENPLVGGPKIEFGDEEITVPAGRYACRRIAFVNEYPGYKSVTTWWLAADVGPVRIESGREKLELKELRKGKGKALAPRAPIAAAEREKLKKRLAECLARFFKERERKEPSEELRKMMDEATAIMQDLTGGDRTKVETVMEESVRAYAPELVPELEKAQRESNERNAAATLKTLTTAQADFRSNDRDGNGVNDYWVADVSGLGRIDAGGRIRLIEDSAALADAKPCVPLDTEGEFHALKFAAAGKPSPKAGYRFVALPGSEDEGGRTVAYDEGKGRCRRRFGFCGYPAEYGKEGKLTFITSEENEIWKKDTGGKVPERFPFAPGKEGWSRLD